MFSIRPLSEEIEMAPRAIPFILGRFGPTPLNVYDDSRLVCAAQ
jgi:hypothetical protein